MLVNYSDDSRTGGECRLTEWATARREVLEVDAKHDTSAIVVGSSSDVTADRA